MKTPSKETDVFRNTDSSVSHHIRDLHFEDNKKTLGTVLSSLPGASLKRKFSSDAADLQTLDIPSKIPRKGQFLNVVFFSFSFKCKEIHNFVNYMISSSISVINRNIA